MARVSAKNMPMLKVIPLGDWVRSAKIWQLNIKMKFYQDCGMSFPDDEMFGIDAWFRFYYVPDQNKTVRAVVITTTWGPYRRVAVFIGQNRCVPVYGTKLSLGLIQRKLDEKMMDKARLMRQVTIGEVIKLGRFEVEFIRNNHSIADSCSLLLNVRGLRLYIRVILNWLYPCRWRSNWFAAIGRNRWRYRLTAFRQHKCRVSATPSEKVGNTLMELFRGCKVASLLRLCSIYIAHSKFSGGFGE